MGYLKRIVLFILYCLGFEIVGNIGAYCFGTSLESSKISLLMVIVFGFLIDQRHKQGSSVTEDSNRLDRR